MVESVPKKWPFTIKLLATLTLAFVIGLTYLYTRHNLSEDQTKNPSKKGQLAPNLDLVPLDGKITKKLADFRGNVVLLSFWASWCGPCLIELPIFGQLADHWKDDGLKVVAINVDEPQPNDFIEDFWQKHKIPFETFVDPNQKAVQQLNVSILPTSFVIDRSGQIVLTSEGFTDWENGKTKVFLEALLRGEPEP